MTPRARLPIGALVSQLEYDFVASNPLGLSMSDFIRVCVELYRVYPPSRAELKKAGVSIFSFDVGQELARLKLRRARD